MQQVILKLDWYGRIVLTVIALLLLGLLLKPHYTVERVVRVDEPSQGGVIQAELGAKGTSYRIDMFGGPRYPLVVKLEGLE